MSEDGSVIFNCICISSAYEWYVIYEYLSKFEKSGWMYIIKTGQNSEGHQLLVYVDWKSGIDINFVLSVTNHSWAVFLIPIDVSLVAKMSWLISKVAERSSNMIMEPYLDEAVLCNLSSICVMVVSVLLKDVYALWKIFNILYLCRYALSCLATILSRVLDRVYNLEIGR